MLNAPALLQATCRRAARRVSDLPARQRLRGRRRRRRAGAAHRRARGRARCARAALEPAGAAVRSRRRMAALHELFDAWFVPRQPLAEARAARAAAGQWRAISPTATTADGHTIERDKPTQPRDAASREAVLGSADFRTLTEREHALDIEALMRRFARQLGRSACAARPCARRPPARPARHDPAQRGQRRHADSTGVAPPPPRAATPGAADRRQPLDGAVQLFLSAAGACARSERADMHSFIFHTGVTRCRSALHDPDPWRAQERLHLIAQGFGGGTRIGESLAQFNREHAPRLVHARTAVIVLSDGYDTGDSAAAVRCTGATEAPRAPHRLAQPAAATSPAMRQPARACRPRCRTSICWRRAATWRASARRCRA